MWPQKLARIYFRAQWKIQHEIFRKGWQHKERSKRVQKTVIDPARARSKEEKRERLQPHLLWLRTLPLIFSGFSLTSGRGSVLLFDLPHSAFATQWSCLKGYLPLSVDVKRNVCVRACVSVHAFCSSFPPWPSDTEALRSNN